MADCDLCTVPAKLRAVYTKMPECGDDCWPYSKLFCVPHARAILDDWMKHPVGQCPDRNHDIQLRAIEPLYVR